jgi:hypothetical protein
LTGHLAIIDSVLRRKLAGAYARAGRLRESIDYYKRALAGRKRVLGTDHPATRPPGPAATPSRTSATAGTPPS